MASAEPGPDPIEIARGELERRVRLRPAMPKTTDELFTALSEEWAAIPSFFFKAFVESMPKWVQNVIEVGGAGTKY